MIDSRPAGARHLRGTGLLAAALLAAATSPLPAAETDRAAAARAYESQARRLEAEMDAAQAAWSDQRRLVADLDAAAATLERACADREIAASELRRLEARFEAALEAAYRQAKRTSEARLRVYDEMDRASAAARALDAAAAPPAGEGPAGLWRVEVEWSELVGVMRLEVAGTLVRGTYRMSNGRSGSLVGSWGGERVDLTRVDRETGRDAELEAELDEDGALEGTWQRFDLVDGHQATGRWRAVRIGSADEVPELGAAGDPERD
jgi:hypothetical protein